MATKVIAQVLQDRFSRPLTAREQDVTPSALEDERYYSDYLHEQIELARARRRTRPVRRVVWSSASEMLRRPRAAVTDRSTSRRLSYAPEVDGAADPGEVVWTDVTFEEDAARTKDRPVLVVGRKNEHTVQALLLSTRRPRRHDRNWIGLGRGAWDGQGRRSFVRLDRVLELDENSLRREGAVLEPAQFNRVCAHLRCRYGWS